ncbi:MAG: hypothetical protein GY847_32025 [Proteobacteria bacterium]|nr:hypothetical protein [Pseudomonadota bacterium]
MKLLKISLTIIVLGLSACMDKENSNLSQEDIMGQWGLVRELRKFGVNGDVDESTHDDETPDEYMVITKNKIDLYYQAATIDIDTLEQYTCIGIATYNYILSGNQLDDDDGSFQGTEKTLSNTDPAPDSDTENTVIGETSYFVTVHISNERLIMNWREDSILEDGESYWTEIELHYAEFNSDVPPSDWPTESCNETNFSIRPGIRLRVSGD